MTETLEECEIRLQKRRAADKRRREQETPGQRGAAELDKQTANAKRRRLEEPTDKREARLENKSSYEKQARAKETPEKRKARLEVKSSYERQVRAEETRKDRLEGKRSNDGQHRKIETPEKRTMRLMEKTKRYNARRRQSIGLVPAAILADEAIKKFHYGLEASECNTCHESLPSMTDFNDHQCRRCGKDSALFS